MPCGPGHPKAIRPGPPDPSLHPDHDLRDRWLNPPEWAEWVEEPVPRYPKRPVPRNDAAAKELKKRTLANLYNDRAQWLADVRHALDSAGAEAYGWTADITEEEVLARLLELNLGQPSSR